MKFIRTSEKDWDEKKGYSKKVFFNEKDLNSPGSQVQEIKIKPRETAKNHCHKIQTEIFYFFDNNGYFVVNGERVSINQGDIIVIEPNDWHEVVNNTDNDFIYLCFKINYKEDDLYWAE